MKKLSLVIAVIISFLLSTILGVLSNLAATYLAPNWEARPGLVYGAFIITFIISLSISISLSLRNPPSTDTSAKIHTPSLINFHSQVLNDITSAPALTNQPPSTNDQPSTKSSISPDNQIQMMKFEITPADNWPEFVYLVPTVDEDRGYIYRQLTDRSKGQGNILREGRGLPIFLKSVTQRLDPQFAYITQSNGMYYLHGGLPNSRGRCGTLKVNSYPIENNGSLLEEGAIIEWGNEQWPILVIIRFKQPGKSPECQQDSPPAGLEPFSLEEHASWCRQNEKYQQAALDYRALKQFGEAAACWEEAAESYSSQTRAELLFEAAIDHLATGRMDLYTLATQAAFEAKGGPMLNVRIKTPEIPLAVHKPGAITVFLENVPLDARVPRTAYNIRLEWHEQEYPHIILGKIELSQLSPSEKQWEKTISFTPSRAGWVTYEMTLTYAKKDGERPFQPPLVETFMLDIQPEPLPNLIISGSQDIQIFQGPTNYARGDVGLQRMKDE